MARRRLRHLSLIVGTLVIAAALGVLLWPASNSPASGERRVRASAVPAGGIDPPIAPAPSATSSSDPSATPNGPPVAPVRAASAAPSAAPSPSVSPTASETPAPPYVIAAAGDIACDPTNTFFRHGRGTVNWCRQADTAALVEHLKPDMVVELGDAQYDEGKLDQFHQSYAQSWGAFKNITYPIIGNHDYWAGKPQGYFDYFGPKAGDPMRGWYSLNRAGWHLIALNSNCTYEISCAPGSPEYEWLKQDLAASSATCQVAFMHHPRFSSGPHGDERSVTPLWRLLNDAGVELVLDGHDHIYERFAKQTPDGVRDPNGIREITVGTGGAEHYVIKKRHANSVVRNARTFGILKLSLLPTSYDWRFVPVGGNAFSDEGSDTCH
jgi:acid phosphatase type 7